MTKRQRLVPLSVRHELSGLVPARRQPRPGNGSGWLSRRRSEPLRGLGVSKESDAARRAREAIEKAARDAAKREAERRAHEARMAEIKAKEDARRAQAEADLKRRLAEQKARDEDRRRAEQIAEQARRRKGK